MKALILYNHSDNEFKAIFVTTRNSLVPTVPNKANVQELVINTYEIELLKALKASKYWETLAKEIIDSGILRGDGAFSKASIDINTLSLDDIISIVNSLNEEDYMTDDLVLKDTE